MIKRSLLILGTLGFLFCSSPDEGPMTMDPPPEPLGPDEIRLKIDKRCPGPICSAEGDGVLRVGVAKVDVSPLIEPFNDKNKLRDDDEEFIDRNGNGTFDAY